MSQSENPLRPRRARLDRDESFPPRLFEPSGPALLSEMDDIAALLVAGELLKFVSKHGGSRLRPGEVEAAVRRLGRAVPPEVRAHCAAEARLIADWIDDPPDGDVETYSRHDDLDVLRRSDVRSRLTVARWAIDDGLNLELEWYDEATDTWPRARVEPVELRDEEEVQEALIVRINGDEVTVPVVNIRWLMPVERPERDLRTQEPTGATLLAFPGAGPISEEE